MSKRELPLYLQDIIDCLNKIDSYVQSFSYEKFVNNQMVLDAVIRNFEIIGEAAKNIPNEVREKHPEIPWQKMISFRNTVLHEYFGIDIELLWQTIEEDVPGLAEKIQKILDEQK